MLTIIVAGLDCQHFEGEEYDQTTLLLPKFQPKLIQRAANATEGSVVLIITSRGVLIFPLLKANSKSGAILWARYPSHKGA